jgi:hypothetical protein
MVRRAESRAQPHALLHCGLDWMESEAGWKVLSQVGDLTSGNLIEFALNGEKRVYYCRPSGTVSYLYDTKEDYQRDNRRKFVASLKLIGCRFAIPAILVASQSDSCESSEDFETTFEKRRLVTRSLSADQKRHLPNHLDREHAMELKLREQAEEIARLKMQVESLTKQLTRVI